MTDELPRFFTIVYLADVVTTLAAATMWGGFPYSNMVVLELLNSVLMWVVLKIIVYAIIIFTYRYLSRYGKYAENILLSVTVVYAILTLNHLSSLTVVIPGSDISPEFLQALEQNKIEYIP